MLYQCKNTHPESANQKMGIPHMATMLDSMLCNGISLLSSAQCVARIQTQILFPIVGPPFGWLNLLVLQRVVNIPSISLLYTCSQEKTTGILSYLPKMCNNIRQNLTRFFVNITAAGKTSHINPA